VIAGTRGAFSRPGVCTAFGESVVCDPKDGTFSYRCSATKTPDPVRGTSVFAGKWHGYCEQKRAAAVVNGRNLGFVCTSVPYRQEYTVTYDDETTAFFTGPQLQKPVPVLLQTLSIPASGPLSDLSAMKKYSRSQSPIAKSQWFSGQPWSISLSDDGGCYEAWANSTHYQEMGNGANVFGIQSSCPSCAQNGPNASLGKCRSDGELTCGGSSSFSYRCTARRAVPSCYSPSVISEYIIEQSSSSITFATVRTVASVSEFSSTEQFVAGWGKLRVVISPTFLDGSEPFPQSAYPSTASFLASPSSAPNPSLSLPKLTSPSSSSSSSPSSFGYVTSAEAIVAAAGVPDTIDGVPWQYLGVHIHIIISASTSSSSISDVVIKVARWSLASPSLPRPVQDGADGVRGVRVTATAIVVENYNTVYFTGILLTFAEGVVLFCFCYLLLFAVMFVFYGVRQIWGGESAPADAEACPREERHSAVEIDAAGLSDAGVKAVIKQNEGVANNDAVPRVVVSAAISAAEVVLQRTNSRDVSVEMEQAKSSAASNVIQHKPLSSSIVAADPHLKPAAQSKSAVAPAASEPPPSAPAPAPALAPVTASTKAAMLDSLSDIVASATPSAPLSAKGPSTASAAMSNSSGSTPMSNKATNVFKAERARSATAQSFSVDTNAGATPLPASQQPTAAAKSKMAPASKEAVNAAIDMFKASASIPPTATGPLPVKTDPATLHRAPAAKIQEASVAASRTTTVTSPVPKLDLTKAVQEQVVFDDSSDICELLTRFAGKGNGGQFAGAAETRGRAAA
jgi:hypothetical protein